MGKEKRMLWKLIVTLVGIAALLVCMLSGIRFVTELDRRADAIQKKEASVLMRALCEQLLVPEDGQKPETGAARMEACDSLLEEWEAGPEDVLLYGEYSTMIRTLTGETGRSENRSPKQSVGRAAFYEEYFMLIEQYQLEDQIQRKQMVILSDGRNAVVPQEEQEEGRKPEEPVVVAEDGWYYDKSGRTEEKELLFRPFGAVVQGHNLLAVEREPEEDALYEIRNIWLMDAQEDHLRCFWNNTEFDILLPSDWKGKEEVRREQVADLAFRGGEVDTVVCKQEKVSGKILSVGENMIEVEGAGTLFFADQFKIYKLYGKLERYYTSQLRVGYAFTDFVLEDGKVAACLVTKDEAMENIRVLIQAGNYGGTYHDRVSLTCDTGYEILYGERQERRKAGEEFRVEADSDYFEQSGRILIRPDALTGRIRLNSIERSQGIPEYRGTLEIVKNSDGIFVINEVLLEEYLYAVVPSEMPSSYPPEALKAQAVCARTYAYRKMLHAGLGKFGAHVDDSTTYQVYNNILEHTETTKAVKDTRGELLYAGEQEADTYYYSTSCGFGTDAGIWKGGDGSELAYLMPRHIAAQGGGAETEPQSAESMKQEEAFASYIGSVHENDYESGQPWYRWEYTVDELEEDALLERLRIRYQVNPKLVLTLEGEEYAAEELEELGEIREIRVEKRGPGGIIDELVIEGSKNTVKVISEHNVRYVLCHPGYGSVVRKDGSSASVSSLLPSSFFIISCSKENDIVVGYKITGGGFGHGVGMSQNAAKEMAAAGMNYDEILAFFYEKAEVRAVHAEKETQSDGQQQTDGL